MFAGFYLQYKVYCQNGSSGVYLGVIGGFQQRSIISIYKHNKYVYICNEVHFFHVLPGTLRDTRVRKYM